MALGGVGSGFSVVMSLRGQVGIFRRRQRGNRQWQGWGLTHWYRCSSVSGSHLGFGERQGTVRLRGILGMGLEREVELFINALVIWGRLGGCSPRRSVGALRPRHNDCWRQSGGWGMMIWTRREAGRGGFFSRSNRWDARSVCTKVGVLVVGNVYGVGMRIDAGTGRIARSLERKGLLGRGAP